MREEHSRWKEMCKGPQLRTCLECWKSRETDGQCSWRSEQELEKGTRSERWSLWKHDLKTQTIFKALALTWIDMGSLRALSRRDLIFPENERLIWFIYWVCVLRKKGGSQMKSQQTFRMSSKWSWWLGPEWYEWRWKRVARS